MVTKELQDLIRFTRREVSGLSQRQAALAAGELSEVWWRQVETGRADAPADTVARMCYSINVSPDQLRAIGQDEIADLVERRHELLEPEQPELSEMEVYLMHTPGLTDTQRHILVDVANGLHRVDAEATSATIAR